MRDLIVVGIVVLGSVIALRRPWVGVMLWTWISIMNPHRYTWGFAYDAPLAAMAAGSTMLGLLFTRDKREWPVKGIPVAWLLAFMGWVTLSWLFGLDWRGDQEQWEKVMKIDLMILIALVVLHSKLHIMALTWVCVLSLALLGAKGGLFTLATAGAYRVWGPAYSYIGDNNHFALALIMTIPLLRFLQMQLGGRWARWGMTAMMILVAAAALGSHSRGALLAITAMTTVMWWRGRSRLLGGLVMITAGFALVSFMPDNWTQRMSTIRTYEEDLSAMGRLAAWWVAWGIGWDYPFGVGFDSARPFLFERYSPYPEVTRPVVAHSIYFQVLGHHGFVGLFFFLAIWVSSYWWAWRIRREARDIPEARWAVDLATMAQVALIGYAVGGAFLDLAYFDLPYNIMVLVVLTRVWVRRRAWETEPAYKPGWRTLPGLIDPRLPAPEPSARPAPAGGLNKATP